MIHFSQTFKALKMADLFPPTFRDLQRWQELWRNANKLLSPPRPASGERILVQAQHVVQVQRCRVGQFCCCDSWVDAYFRIGWREVKGVHGVGVSVFLVEHEVRAVQFHPPLLPSWLPCSVGNRQRAFDSTEVQASAASMPHLQHLPPKTPKSWRDWHKRNQSHELHRVFLCYNSWLQQMWTAGVGGGGGGGRTSWVPYKRES